MVGKKATGSAADAAIETMPSDPSVIVASNRGFSSIPKPPPIPNGFLGLAIGSALVCFEMSYFFAVDWRQSIWIS